MSTKKLEEFSLQLFDLDDTLINTCQSYLTAYSEIFNKNLSPLVLEIKNLWQRLPRTNNQFFWKNLKPFDL